MRQQKSQGDKLRHLRWWQSELGDCVVSDVTPALIAQYRNKLANGITQMGAVRSPATVVRYLAALSHAFSLAVREWECLDANPVLKVTKPKEPRGRVRFLSDQEHERLLSACESSQNPYLNIVVLLALSTLKRQASLRF